MGTPVFGGGRSPETLGLVDQRLTTEQSFSMYKSNLIVWSSGVAACFSASWVLLLAALVARSKLSNQPFPVLAKFSPFRDHLAATDKMLQAFPFFALLALVLIGIAWYRAGSFRAVRPAATAIGMSLLVSLLVIALNPGGYFSWFLS